MPSHKHKPKHKPKPKPQPGPAPVPSPIKPPVKPGEQPKPAEPAAPVVPVDMADPGVVLDEKTKSADPYAYQKNTRGAALYGPNGVQALDVKQGYIGDCFLAAALTAVAGSRPDLIKNAITDNGNGTFTVRFYEVDWSGQKKVHKETVDSDLPWDPASNGPAYARSAESTDGKNHLELWPSILEKAYAQWKGSYDAIGHGGISGDVMEALTGERARQQTTQGAGDNDPLWTKMKQASADKKPMTAGSGGEEDPRYKDPKAGVYGWHAYTILGVEEKKNGDKTERFVTARNPWGKRRRGSDAAAVGDKTNDTAGGVFQLPWAEFRRLFDNVTVGG